MQLKSALREICKTFRPPLRLTPHQSIIFCDIAPEDRDRLEEILRRHNVPLTEDYTTVRRWSMACPALPTCGLAVTESERVMPEIIDQLEVELEKLGLQDEVFTTRMTGCPNGCAGPYNSDIGLVGKTKDKYTIFLGGRVLGDRLNFIYKDLVPTDEVVPTLVPVLRYFKDSSPKRRILRRLLPPRRNTRPRSSNGRSAGIAGRYLEFVCQAPPVLSNLQVLSFGISSAIRQSRPELVPRNLRSKSTAHFASAARAGCLGAQSIVLVDTLQSARHRNYDSNGK